MKKYAFLSQTAKIGIIAVSIVSFTASYHPLLADQGSTVNRPSDATVITGSAVPTLQGIMPNELAGFRYTTTGWEQIPVQMDERDIERRWPSS